MTARPRAAQPPSTRQRSTSTGGSKGSSLDRQGAAVSAGRPDAAHAGTASQIEKSKPQDDQELAFDEGAEYVALVEEYNALAEQLEESAVWFEFGPGSKPALDAANAKAEADGVGAEDENRVLYEMAETMISPRVPGAALVALRNRMGDPVFMSLYNGWREALTLSKSVGAPFSPLPSHTPPTGE